MYDLHFLYSVEQARRHMIGVIGEHGHTNPNCDLLILMNLHRNVHIMNYCIDIHIEIAV